MKALIMKNIVDRKEPYFLMLLILFITLALNLDASFFWGAFIYSFFTLKTNIPKSYPISLKMHLWSLIWMGVLVLLSGSILVLLFSFYKPFLPYDLLNFISILFIYCFSDWATTIKNFKFSGNQMLILVLYLVILVFIFMVLNIYPMERMVYAVLVSLAYFSINFIINLQKRKGCVLC